jgi:ligand-binding sensor domain-containing protein
MQPSPRVTGAAARSLLLLVRLFLLAPCVSRSEQLPLKSYSTADGLAHDHVNRIRRDSRGFLWFCTDEGLSRFDGYQFTTYTTQHGLPHLHVNDLLETRGGVYWIATDGGVCRFNSTGSRAAKTQTPPPTVFGQASP